VLLAEAQTQKTFKLFGQDYVKFAFWPSEKTPKHSFHRNTLFQRLENLAVTTHTVHLTQIVSAGTDPLRVIILTKSSEPVDTFIHSIIYVL
jgi:hypothetical protein